MDVHLPRKEKYILICKREEGRGKREETGRTAPEPNETGRTEPEPNETGRTEHNQTKLDERHSHPIPQGKEEIHYSKDSRHERKEEDGGRRKEEERKKKKKERGNP